ncbi:MAG: sugar phosphate isomerase/epimerase [Chloroflexi bacterium]|nr:sugar phosphate isomerase/epimerase [Chloroflexota bacterium]
MSDVKLCLFASTPDMLNHDFIVKVLTGTPEELGRTAIDWGYDGIEFMPDPDHVPDPELFATSLGRTGAVMPVVNSGRIAAQGLALLHESISLRKKSIQGFKNILDFAGHFKALVGLGAARGKGIPGMSKADMERMAEEIFGELAAHAAKAGAVIVLESAEAEFTSLFNTNAETMAMVARVGSPHFSIMLDTHQLWAVETSIEEGIRAAQGQAQHIHLYDPSRLPPGVSPEKEALDWPNIVRLLREEGFHGSASVVIAPEGDPEPVARQSAAYLRSIFNG